MPRSNSPSSLANWHASAPHAHFRASVNGNAHWDVGRPSPNLASAARISPGGRMLMAFELAEIRDYFVEGHADQGAQAEPDGCERARPRQENSLPAHPRPEDLASSVAVQVEATRQLEQAYTLLQGAFNDEFSRLLAAGKSLEAVAVLRAMPDTHLRTAAIFDLQKSGWDFDANPVWKVEAAPYSRDQASALVLWQRARLADEVAGRAYGEFAMARAREILNEEGNEAVEAFAATLPRGVTYAFVMDMARYGKPREGSGPSSPRM